VKARTNAFAALDVRELQRVGALAPGKKWDLRWPDFLDVAQVRMQTEACLELRSRARGVQRPLSQPVELMYTSLNYGGRRAWFLCDCGRKVAKLYHVGLLWICRQCAQLDYETQHEGRFERAYRRELAVHRRLGTGWPDNGHTWAPPPARPRGMHRSTYLGLCLRLSRCSREMYGHIGGEAMLRALGG
jgi:hypothetical protein